MARSIFITHLWHKVKARSGFWMVLWGAGCGRIGSPRVMPHGPQGLEAKASALPGLRVFRVWVFLCSLSVLIQIIYCRINKTQLWAKFNLCLPAGSSCLPGRLREDRTRPKGVRQGQRGARPPQHLQLGFLSWKAHLNHLQKLCHYYFL